MSQPQWLSDVEASYTSDAHAQSLIAMLVIDEHVVLHFSFQDGLLRYKSRIWIGQDSALQT